MRLYAETENVAENFRDNEVESLKVIKFQNSCCNKQERAS